MYIEMSAEVDSLVRPNVKGTNTLDYINALHKLMLWRVDLLSVGSGVFWKRCGARFQLGIGPIMYD